MPQYKLIYFNITAHAEPIRWILKWAKQPLEEERIEFSDWEAQKSRFPNGQVPVLLEDGKELTQAISIGRYLAKKYGLTTGDQFLDYRVDQVVDILMDARLQWVPHLMENDAEKKEEKKKNLVANVFPKVLKQLNEIVGETDGDFIAGDKLTFGDFWLANWLQIWAATTDPNLGNEYPALMKVKETVLAIPEIKNWISERPKTFV